MQPPKGKSASTFLTATLTITTSLLLSFAIEPKATAHPFEITGVDILLKSDGTVEAIVDFHVDAMLLDMPSVLPTGSEYENLLIRLAEIPPDVGQPENGMINVPGQSIDRNKRPGHRRIIQKAGGSGSVSWPRNSGVQRSGAKATASQGRAITCQERRAATIGTDMGAFIRTRL